jgi:hypothetical protein
MKLQNAVSLLNSELLERVPTRRNVLSRSSRNSTKNVLESDQSIHYQDHNPDIFTGQSIQSSLTGTPITHGSHHKKFEKGLTNGKRRGPQIGGLIPASMASIIDRSWLELHRPSSSFDPSFYVPQVGDRVL